MRFAAMTFIAMAGMTSMTTGPTVQQPPHDHQMMQRGQQAMGFDQATTTHHFLLQKAGGAIEITAKATADPSAVESIRSHLQHIRAAFSEGDFALPMFIHGTEPPGAAMLKERRARLNYRYEEIPAGGRLAITTSDAEALSALHAFLTFQINEHKTGDSLVPK